MMSESEKNEFRVSAVLPAYNAEDYIARAIDSVLNQTFPAFEIIVVDDGSTDSTAEVIKGYGDNVRYIYQDNSGASVARNTGVKAANGDWIAFLDGDDEWLEKHIELFTGVLAGHKNLRWAFGNFIECDCRTETRKVSLKKQIPDDLHCKPGKFESYLRCFAQGYYAWTSAVIIKRSVFDKAGFFTAGMKRAQDTDMWLRIAYHYPEVAYVTEPVAIYHRGVGGSASKSNKDVIVFGDLIEKHLKLSGEFGVADDFAACAGGMLSVWIRDMVSTGHTDGVLETLERFDGLLKWRFKKEMWLRVKHPRIAPVAIALTSSIKKFKRILVDLLRPVRD